MVCHEKAASDERLGLRISRNGAVAKLQRVISPENTRRDHGFSGDVTFLSNFGNVARFEKLHKCRAIVSIRQE